LHEKEPDLHGLKISRSSFCLTTVSFMAVFVFVFAMIYEELHEKGIKSSGREN
jgi:hypothetical protein